MDYAVPYCLFQLILRRLKDEYQDNYTSSGTIDGIGGMLQATYLQKNTR
jgi:hypothetical protein